LLNHSCDPNAVVGFDQGRIFVKALRPIKEGEQIFISYIDSTNPFAVRQKSLLDRYFFNCTCSKCAKGTAAREDKFLTPNPDMSDLINAEQPAAEVLASIEAGCSWADAVTKLTAAMDSLKETGVWPITRQPFVQLRDELSFYLLAEKQFGPAFVQLAIRHLKVDPVIFPGPWHPLRNVHAWTLVKVAILLFQPLQKSGVNLGLIIYSLLRTLNESASYELPTASREYKDTYEGARKEFIDNGLDPDNMEADLRAEWANLERLLDEPSMWATLSPLSPEELSAL
jgi:SET and MYND domain-containing protein